MKNNLIGARNILKKTRKS